MLEPLPDLSSRILDWRDRAIAGTEDPDGRELLPRTREPHLSGRLVVRAPVRRCQTHEISRTISRTICRTVSRSIHSPTFRGHLPATPDTTCGLEAGLLRDGRGQHHRSGAHERLRLRICDDVHGGSGWSQRSQDRQHHQGQHCPCLHQRQNDHEARLGTPACRTPDGVIACGWGTSACRSHPCASMWALGGMASGGTSKPCATRACETRSTTVRNTLTRA